MFDIPLDLYKIYCMVVKTESMSRAAKELFISQPAVSMAIKQLEERFGRELLIRTPKGIRPTLEGQVLYENLSKGLHMIRSAEIKYFEMAKLLAGEIRIGASDNILSSYLMPYVERYMNAFPDINIKITNKTSPETIHLLKSGSVDLGFVNLPIDVDDSLEIIELCSVTDCLVGGTAHKHLCECGVKFSEIGSLPLMLLEGISSTRRYLDAFALKNGLIFKPVIELGSVELLIKFTKINLGVTFVIREFLSKEDAGEVLEIPLIPAIPSRKIGLVKLKDVPITHAAEKLIEMIIG